MSSNHPISTRLAHNPTVRTIGRMKTRWRRTLNQSFSHTSLKRRSNWTSKPTTQPLSSLISSQVKVQIVYSLLKLLEDNRIYVVMVPANCTDRLQPMDISVNKPAKNFLRQQFQEWYAKKICQQLHHDEGIVPVDLRLSIVKPLGAQWMIKLFDYFKARPDIIRNGFEGAGIVDCLTDS